MAQNFRNAEGQNFRNLHALWQKNVAQFETREAERQRSVAGANAAEARKQKKAADDNAAEATRQKNIAIENEAEAKKQEGIAKDETAVAQRIQTESKARELAAFSTENLNDVPRKEYLLRPIAASLVLLLLRVADKSSKWIRKHCAANRG